MYGSSQYTTVYNDSIEKNYMWLSVSWHSPFKMNPLFNYEQIAIVSLFPSSQAIVYREITERHKKENQSGVIWPCD